MKLLCTYSELIMSEAIYRYWYTRYMQRGDGYLQYIYSQGCYERAQAAYDYAVKCAHESENESRRAE